MGSVAPVLTVASARGRARVIDYLLLGLWRACNSDNVFATVQSQQKLRADAVHRLEQPLEHGQLIERGAFEHRGDVPKAVEYERIDYLQANSPQHELETALIEQEQV